MAEAADEVLAATEVVPFCSQAARPMAVTAVRVSSSLFMLVYPVIIYAK